MSQMTRRMFTGTTLVLLACSPVVLGAQSASAFPKGDSVIAFDYHIDATTHVKKSDQTITVKGGKFHGLVDFDTAQLRGTISLPDATTITGVGGVGVVAIKTRTIPTAPVTGKINLNNFKVTSTSHFLLKIVSVTAVIPAGLPLPLPQVNLVGDHCQTVAPINVTMSGIANLGAASTFKGTFSIPPVANCQGLENALNQLIPGPGNTFVATATP
jgi:hypothetical protein